VTDLVTHADRRPQSGRVPRCAPVALLRASGLRRPLPEIRPSCGYRREARAGDGLKVEPRLSFWNLHALEAPAGPALGTPAMG